MPTETCTKASGAMTKQTGMASLLMPTMPCTPGSGLKTLSTAMAKSNGIMEPPDTRDSSIRARKMAKAGSTGRTEATIRGNS